MNEEPGWDGSPSNAIHVAPHKPAQRRLYHVWKGNNVHSLFSGFFANMLLAILDFESDATIGFNL